MKRIVLTFTCIVLLLSMAVFPSSAEVVTGDVNGDGAVDSLDALVAIRLLADLTYTGKVQKEALFVSGDGTVDMADAALLLRKAADPTVELFGIPADRTVAETEDGTLYYAENKLKLMCLNVRHSYGEAPNTRPVRITRIQKLLAEQLPAVVGFQEVRTWWMNEDAAQSSQPGLPDIMPTENYQGYVYYRNEQYLTDTAGDLDGREGCAIFYDTSVVTLLQKGVYWLSETPNTESKPELSGTYRIAVWGKFRINATGEEFYFNTAHIDTVDEIQPYQYNVVIEQSKLIAQTYGDAPIVYCGDYNFCKENDPSEGYAALQASGVTDVALALGDTTGTFPNYGQNTGTANPRGDYFCITGDVLPASYWVETRVWDPETEEAFYLEGETYKNEYGYYSDHSPIFMEAVLY